MQILESSESSEKSEILSIELSELYESSESSEIKRVELSELYEFSEKFEKRQTSIKVITKTAKTDDFRGAGNFWTSPADSTQKTAPDRLIFSFVRPQNSFFSSMYRRSSYETP